MRNDGIWNASDAMVATDEGGMGVSLSIVGEGTVGGIGIRGARPLIGDARPRANTISSPGSMIPAAIGSTGTHEAGPLIRSYRSVMRGAG